VVGVRGKSVQLAPYAETEGIEVGNPVIGLGRALDVPVSDQLLGRVLDGTGRPIDGGGEIGSGVYYPIFNKPPTY
jgi:flagellum-specific ATP synthase